MSKMQSILRFAQIQDVNQMIAAIENLTHGKVVGLSEMFGQAYITIEHHEGPVCPSCGKEIHSHGHGLCLSCWTIKSKELKGL